MDNINDIISSLSADDIKALKETAEAIFGNSEQSGSSPFATFNDTNNKQNDTSFNTGMFQNAEMFSKIGKVMSMLQSGGTDKRCELIEALKPNLSQRRQHKADEAIRILKLLELLPMLSELTGRGD